MSFPHYPTPATNILSCTCCPWSFLPFSHRPSLWTKDHTCVISQQKGPRWWNKVGWKPYPLSASASPMGQRQPVTSSCTEPVPKTQALQPRACANAECWTWETTDHLLKSCLLPYDSLILKESDTKKKRVCTKKKDDYFSLPASRKNFSTICMRDFFFFYKNVLMVTKMCCTERSKKTKSTFPQPSVHPEASAMFPPPVSQGGHPHKLVNGYL